MPRGIFGDEFKAIDFAPDQLFDVYDLTEFGDPLIETYTTDQIVEFGFNTDDYGLTPVNQDFQPTSLRKAKKRGDRYWRFYNPFVSISDFEDDTSDLWEAA